MHSNNMSSIYRGYRASNRTLLIKNEIFLCFCFLCQNQRNGLSNQVLFTEESMNLTVCEQVFESGQVFEEVVLAKNAHDLSAKEQWMRLRAWHGVPFSFASLYSVFGLLQSSPFSLWAMPILETYVFWLRTSFNEKYGHFGPSEEPTLDFPSSYSFLLFF